jgi:hypothetical protein
MRLVGQTAWTIRKGYIPGITFEQAKKFTESMIKGEPHLGHMIKQTFKEAVESFLPHKRYRALSEANPASGL